MAREFARSFYNSQAWRSCRESYKRYKGGLCEDCLARGIITAGAEVHHVRAITPENIGDPNVTLSWDNLALLCKDCHMARHKAMAEGRAGRKRSPRRYDIDPRTGRVEAR